MADMVRKGDQFRSIIADDNALWEVTKTLGNDTFECIVVNEPIEINGELYDGDHAGMVDVFMGDQIRRSKGLADLFERERNKNDEFFESLTLGQIVHYHDGFGNYVRCRVVTDGNQKMLKSIALVGAWKDMDLPRRFPGGHVSIPYQSKKVLEGDTFRPNHSNVYESPSFVDKHGVDPGTLYPIDLTLPDPTPKEQRYHDKIALLNEISEAARDKGRINDPDATLDEVERLLEEGRARIKKERE